LFQSPGSYTFDAACICWNSSGARGGKDAELTCAAAGNFYILLMLPVAVQLVVLLALADSWFDFRSRLQNSA